MTGAVAAHAPRERREAASFAAVIVLIGAALIGGLLVRTTVDQAVQRVDSAGLNAELPDGWVILPAAGDRLMTAYDPLDPDLRFGVAAVDATADKPLTPEEAAARRLRDRSQLLEGYLVDEEGPGALGSTVTYRVRYSFVDSGLGRTPTPIAVVEHYLPDGSIFPGEDRVLAIILEAPPDRLDAALPAFERFARELAGRAGSASIGPSSARGAGDRARLGRLIAGLDGAGQLPAPAPAAVGDPVRSTVQVLLTSRLSDNAEVPIGHGSGTIISADGLILTNAHVAMPSAAGLGISYVDPTPGVDPDSLVIAVIEAEDKPPVPTYRASVVTVDGYLDAAVIRIDRHFDGRPIRAGELDLPVLPIGDPDALRIGDPLTIVGFPAIGFETISLSAGRVSGFLGDDRVGDRAWIKTDAVISGGNSGGVAANEAGELIGIPSWTLADTGGYSFIRAVDLVQPLIDAARANRRSVDSPYLVPSTGRESLTLDTWTDSMSACPATTRLTSYPSGSRQVVAAMMHSGFAAGEDVLRQWRRNGEVVYRAGRVMEPGVEAGGCALDGIYHDRGLPDGTYTLEVFAGPTLQAVMTAQTTIGVGGGAGSASLAGLVVDADSGRPVAGAVIFMLTPGTNQQAWLESPREDQVASYAQTGRDGTFLVVGLTAGSTYPALAVAEGYLSAAGTIGPLQDGENRLLNPISLTRVAP